jgi:RNA polymerase sigma factor (sigma-70 family)
LKVKKNYTDNELIAGIKSKNNRIVSQVIKDNIKKINQLVLLNNGSESDAQDLFQETMIVLYRKIQEKDFNLTCSVGTYIYSIAKLLWLKELSKRSKGKLVDENVDFVIDNNAEIQETIQKNERLKLFREKYEELSDDCKKVLHMFLMEIPLKEITQIMGYSSEQHTRNRRYRCKEALIKKIINSKAYKELGYGKYKVN